MLARITVVRRWSFRLLALSAMMALLAGNAAASPGGFVYALRRVTAGANQIYGFRLNSSSGALTPLPGFPIPTGGDGDPLVTSEAVVYAHGRLYVVNRSSLSVFTVNLATGALTAAPFSPVALGATLYCVAANPVNATVVVGSTSGLHALVITPATATVAPGSPFAIPGVASYSCAISRDGRYAYTGGRLNLSTTAGFELDPSTAVLTPLAGSPFDMGALSPVAYATDDAGRFFTAPASGGPIRVFTTSNGIPAPVTGNPFPSALAGPVHGLLNPLGFYIVADRSGDRVGAYRVVGSGSTTTLAAVPGSPFQTFGILTNAVAATPDGGMVVAAHGVTRNLMVFRVNGSTGTLTQLGSQPANTLGATGIIAGLAIAPRSAANPSTDFDGDGKGDVLLRHNFTGQNIGWLMNGPAVSSAAFLPTIPDPSWAIRGTGDFNADGKADVILRNSFTGQNVGWLMNGLTVMNSAFLPTIADTNWGIKGVGDFDGDGKADVIWRNKANGQNIIWLMNGLTVASAAFMPAIADTYWEIKAVGDLDGDGKADAFWRNRVTGQNIGWLMNGLTVASAAFLPTIPDLSWDIKGMGDLDGDGKADVILWNNVAGKVIGWLMNGLTVADSASVFAPGVSNPIKSVTDLDGDGLADIVHRNQVNGQNLVMMMNGLTVTDIVSLPTIPDTFWDIVPARDATIRVFPEMNVPETGTGGSTGAPAGQYPVTINVSGLPPVKRLRVGLRSVTHTSPRDIDVLLVGPGGQKVMLMSDVGGTVGIQNVNMTIDDGAAPMLDFGQLVTRAYAPTNAGTTLDLFPGPAPAGPYGTLLSVFNGTNPNGTWRLYVVDDADQDVGTVGGVSLTFSAD